MLSVHDADHSLTLTIYLDANLINDANLNAKLNLAPIPKREKRLTVTKMIRNNVNLVPENYDASIVPRGGE